MDKSRKIRMQPGLLEIEKKRSYFSGSVLFFVPFFRYDKRRGTAEAAVRPPDPSTTSLTPGK